MKWNHLSILGLILATGFAHADLILGTDFTGVNTSTAPTATNISWTTDDVSLASPDLSFSGTLKTGGAYAVTFISGGTPADNIQVSANVETQGPWSTSFTLTPSASISLANFNLGYRAISATGGNQSVSHSATYTLVISQGATSLGSFSDRVTDVGSNGAVGDTADITFSSLTLDPGLAYTFALTVSSTGTAGNNVAIDNLALNGSVTAVPEPAGTGVAGALFLAALVMVRRRARA